MPDKENQNGWNQNSDQKDNNDDFWGKQRDDFWNKNVMDSKVETEEKTGLRMGGSSQRIGESTQQSYESGQPSNVDSQQSYGGGYVVNNGGSWDYKPPKPGNIDDNLRRDEKEEHPRRVISIFFTAAAVLFIIAASLSGMVGKNIYAKTDKMTEPVEEAVNGNKMRLYEDTVLLVEDQAYTVLQAGAKKGMPANEKLVAVYVESSGQSYEGRINAIRYVYVGNGEEYRTDYRQQELIPYLLDLGFEKNQNISMYYHEVDKKYKGYFFFLVPEDWETLNFYVEQREDGSNWMPVEKTLSKSMVIIEATQGEGLSFLLERGRN